MLALAFVVLIFLFGLLILENSFKQVDPLLTLILSFVFGSILSVWLVYIVTLLISKNITIGIGAYFLFSLILFFSFRIKLTNTILHFVRNISKKEIILIIFLLTSSYLLFSRSFNYDQKNGQFLISSNLYQDMGAHIPFIRSFSMGKNYPSEVPFFAGGKLTYHFMFDFYTGILEKLGLRIDVAYNFLSSISFTILLLIIYKLIQLLFNSKSVAIITVILFLFNSDLSFLSFIKQHGFSLSGIWHNNNYELASLFPISYSPFLHVNVLLNQRHLIMSLAVILVIFYIILEKKAEKNHRFIVMGILIGLLPFWNMFAFISALIILIMSTLLRLLKTKQVLIALLIALIASFPQIILMHNPVGSVAFRPGFLISSSFSMLNFTFFWIWALGLSIVLIVIGFYISNKRQKTVFVVFLPLFLLPNIFQFAPNMFDNHKFFNMWIVIANGFVAFLLLKLFKRNLWLKISSSIIFLTIIFSGILNFLVAKNDVYAKIPDFKNNSFMTWVNDNISKDSIILTNGDIYDPVSLIGSRVFITRPYYIFLYGGNPDKRLNERTIVLGNLNNIETKKILASEKIKNIVIYKKGVAPNLIFANDKHLINNYKKIYEDDYGIIFEI
jgi:hypothetical protein